MECLILAGHIHHLCVCCTQVTYITSVFPFILLIILLIRGVTLDGSMEGILYYITPQWHRLASAKVGGAIGMTDKRVHGWL